MGIFIKPRMLILGTLLVTSGGITGDKCKNATGCSSFEIDIRCRGKEERKAANGIACNTKKKYSELKLGAQNKEGNGKAVSKSNLDAMNKVTAYHAEQ